MKFRILIKARDEVLFNREIEAVGTLDAIHHAQEVLEDDHVQAFQRAHRHMLIEVTPK